LKKTQLTAHIGKLNIHNDLFIQNSTRFANAPDFAPFVKKREASPVGLPRDQCGQKYLAAI
jgi:hypothetical protein